MYQEAESADEIVRWLKTSPTAADLSTVEATKAFIEANEVSIVVFFKDAERGAVKAFKNVACGMCGITSTDAVYTELKASKDGVTLFKKVDLNGIKWRCLSTDSLFVDFLEDPVLRTYSNCLSGGILSAWRRILDSKSGSNQQENFGLSCLKELWLFWHGEEPDFSGILEGPLIEANRGSWKNSLTYKYHTMLLKALHNAIERLLLTNKFTRIGRFFLEPKTLSARL